MQSDTKIYREVNALSRLSHRFIVRYYTTWVEISDPISTAVSDDSGTESGTEDGMTSVPDSSYRYLPTNGGLSINLEDLDDFGSGSQSSFPSIHFGRSQSPRMDDDDDNSDDAFGNLFSPDGKIEPPMTPPPMVSRTLYIQMVSRPFLADLTEGLIVPRNSSSARR